MNENENEQGIEKGTRALTRNKEDLVGRVMTIERIEKKKTTTPEGETREVNLYTASLHYERDKDELVQFFGTPVMDEQLVRGGIYIGDKVSIDKIVSKQSGRTYYTFIILSHTENAIDDLKEAQERRGD